MFTLHHIIGRGHSPASPMRWLALLAQKGRWLLLPFLLLFLPLSPYPDEEGRLREPITRVEELTICCRGWSQMVMTWLDKGLRNVVLRCLKAPSTR